MSQDNIVRMEKFSDLFPPGKIHLCHGESYAGKSHIIGYICKQLIEGKPVFGFPTTGKVIPVYFSLDHDEDEYRAVFERMGLTGEEFKCYPMDDMESVKWKDIQTKLTGYENFIIVEGIASLMSKGDNLNDYLVVRSFLAMLKSKIRPHQVSFLGSTHDSKPNGIERINRQKILGSTAWGAFSSTVIGIEKSNQDGGRTIIVEPRGKGAEPVPPITATMTKKTLVIQEPNAPPPKQAILDMIISFSPGTTIPISWFHETATAHGVSERTVFYWIGEWVKSNLLETTGNKGEYLRKDALVI